VVVAGGAVFVVARRDRTLQNTFFHTDSTSLSPQSSNASRLVALQSAAREVLHEPLGRGPGTAGPASVRNNHPPRIAENYFLQIAQEVGWLGLLLFGLINVVVVRRLWRDRQKLLPQVLLASWVGLTLVNMVSHAWADDTLALLWWGLAGVALAPAILKANARLKYAKIAQKTT
jgi:O-antigen ligase